MTRNDLGAFLPKVLAQDQEGATQSHETSGLEPMKDEKRQNGSPTTNDERPTTRF
jgi:hypothetical protein